MFNANIYARKAKRRMRWYSDRLDFLPWLQVGEIVRQSVHLNFVKGGRPTKWPKRRRSYPHPILRASDTLKNAHYIETILNGVAVGNRLIYQAVHNFGYPPRNIPQREYLLVQDRDRNDINKLFRKHLGLKK